MWVVKCQTMKRSLQMRFGKGKSDFGMGREEDFGFVFEMGRGECKVRLASLPGPCQAPEQLQQLEQLPSTWPQDIA